MEWRNGRFFPFWVSENECVRVPAPFSPLIAPPRVGVGMRSVWVCACGGVSVRATSVNRVRKDSRGRGFAPRLLTLPSELRCVCLSLTRLSLPLLLRAGSLSGSASLPRGAAARGCAPRVCEERMRRASRRQSRAPRESVSAPPPPLAERQIAPGCPTYLCLCPLGWGARSAWRLGVRVRARPVGLSRFGPPPPARLFSRARRPPAARPCAHPLTTRGDCELMSLGPSPRLCAGSRGRPRAHGQGFERPNRSSRRSPPRCLSLSPPATGAHTLLSLS